MKNLALFLSFFISTAMHAQEGCTDPVACNYNSSAITDDGSCCVTCLEVIITDTFGDGGGSVYFYERNTENVLDSVILEDGFEASWSVCMPFCYDVQIYSDAQPEEVAVLITDQYGAELEESVGGDVSPTRFMQALAHSTLQCQTDHPNVFDTSCENHIGLSSEDWGNVYLFENDTVWVNFEDPMDGPNYWSDQKISVLSADNCSIEQLFCAESNFLSPGLYGFTSKDGQAALIGFSYCEYGINLCEGGRCDDPNACNYNLVDNVPTVFDIPSLCEYDCCSDPQASNYLVSCSEPNECDYADELFGCLDPLACNFDSSAQFNDENLCWYFQGECGDDDFGLGQVNDNCECDFVYNGDFNADGIITVTDLAVFLSVMQQVSGPSLGDFNNTGDVTATDLSLFLSIFGQSVP